MKTHRLTLNGKDIETLLEALEIAQAHMTYRPMLAPSVARLAARVKKLQERKAN